MKNTLLATKLNIPKLRSALIPRPRLIDKLNAGLNKRLTLVSAPAGFGKTTLVTDWVIQLTSQTHTWNSEHCTWLSLDQYDNESVRFLQYLISAIQVVYPDLGIDLLETLDHSPKPNIQSITQDLINEVTENGQPLLIVLDDYHEIQNESIHQILQTAIDFLPQHVHFVLTTRQDPPLSLPRWRARNWMISISSSDLRFDQAEAGDFLNLTMQLDVDSEAVALLEERTEGWVAGLQLAALSLADTDFSLESIQQFGGRDRYITDYLLTEVLDQQTTEVKQFLLQSAILDRLNNDLCVTILHPEAQDNWTNLTQHYQSLISTLERSNLFLIPLDHEGYWYRYHHLFAQLLRQRLAQAWVPREIHRLYCRAAYWFAEHGFTEEAIDYALHGEDYAFTANLISDFEVDNIWSQTLGLKLRKWGKALPTETLQEFPKATIYIAMAHMTRNEVKETVHYVELVRNDPRVEADILLIDSIFTRNKGNLPQALEMAVKAGDIFKPVDETKYIASLTQVVVCMWNMGDLSGAEKLATSMLQERQITSGRLINVYAQVVHMLGFIKEMRGQLVEAERVYLDGLETFEQSGITVPLIGLFQVRLAAIYYQWNDIEKAMDYCETGMVWGDRSGISDITLHGLFVQGDLAIYQKDEVATQDIQNRISKLVDWPEFIDISSIILANQAAYQVRLGILPPAIRWADSSGISLEQEPSLLYRAEYHALVRVRYEEIRHLGLRDHAPVIIRMVDRLIDLFMEHDFIDSAIYYQSIKALLLDLNGQRIKAVTSLHEALTLALPGGFIRIFVDLGSPMRDLLQKSLAHEPHMVFKRRLLMAFSEEDIKPATSITSSHEIPVTLTPREFEILELIAAGLSNKAIQENLMLSKNTVRTHIKNLYSKLGVHNRMQAVQEARDNGLI